jgi:hypothetical protein
MDIVNNVVKDVSDTFEGIFSGGSSFVGGLTGTQKIVIGVVILALLVAFIFIVYRMSQKGFSARRVGPAGCCGKLQGQRIAKIEAALSDGDMMRNEDDYARAGMPKINTQYDPVLGAYDNMDFPSGDHRMGFSSPAAKPSATPESPMTDNWNGNGALVRQQVPYSNNMVPSYEESDFVNMAYD